MTYTRHYQNHYDKEHDCKITAFALALISIIIFGISFILFGLGTLPPTALFGLGILPYLGGTFLSFVAFGTAISALVCLAISSVNRCQRNQLAELIDPKPPRDSAEGTDL